MRWEELGEGRPIVFLHGIPTCPALWRRVTPRIPGARKLAWELVGYGASAKEGVERDISVAQQAEYLNAWMEALELSGVLVVGHDLGGGVAQNLALKHPMKVAGIVLTNSIGYGSWPIPRVKMLRAMSSGVEHVPPALLLQLMRNFMKAGHDDPDIAKDSLAVHYANYTGPGGPPAFARQLRSLNVRDTEWIGDRLRDLRIPARIVWGAADKFQKLKYGQKLARQLNAHLTEIPEGKHFVPEDHPDEIVDAVLAVADELGWDLRHVEMPAVSSEPMQL